MPMARRDFLRLSATAAGGFTLAVSVAACRNDGAADGGPAAAGAAFVPDAWIRIAGDGTVTVILARSEMGQGVSTGLPMLIAEELEADWDTLRVEQAPAHTAYGNTALQANMMMTGGSSAVREAWLPLRRAGATARTLLIAAAAARWGVPAAECRAERGEVLHTRSEKRAGFGELAADAARLPVPREVELKPASEWRLIGRALPRRDNADVVMGRVTFGLDVRLPGMLYASVERAPVWGGKVAALDAAAALASPGVRHVFDLGHKVAVVADTHWHALQGRRKLVITWDDGPLAALSDATIGTRMRELADADEGGVARNEGDAPSVLASGNTLEAEYELPFLAHQTMEPMNCTVDPVNGECWVPTQFQDGPALLGGGGARGRLAGGLGRGPNFAKVHTTRLGGGFGRRLEVDYVEEATEIARRAGVPVQVIWTREDDTRHDVYRPRALHRLKGAVDDSGRLVAWQQQIVAPSISRKFVPRAVPDLLVKLAGPLKGGVDQSTVEGAADTPYRIPNLRVTSLMANLGVPVGYWRSVGHSHTAFAVECFVDELARKAGADPVEFRRGLLSHLPRYQAVLDLAATEAGWGTPLPAGRARGVAFHESFGSRVAEVAEVSIEGGKVRVHRVVVAADCGTVVHPDLVRAQLEGAVLFGLSAALHGGVSVEGGKVEESNFHDAPVLRMSEAPVVECHLLPSIDPPGGVGEVGTPPIAPAVANALFALTGTPVRRLPVRA
ncbi:MAG TPA: molybdopterin cofactor-binding domain-containing protein [Gemmatimonadales bacterium]|nr:molybdopterin cofactor-binding domain-containing protein [Gemmatimonadales bacterium]